jgi:hypothetical protein
MNEPVTPTTSTAKRWHLTDIGNAERFAFQHRAWARYCYAWNAWLLWTGTHWRRDPGDGPMRMAKSTAISIYQEIAETTSKDEREEGRTGTYRPVGHGVGEHPPP